MEVRNRFKGLDLIDRVPDELWIEVRDIVQETGIKKKRKSFYPRKRNAKKQNDCLRNLTNSCEKKRSERREEKKERKEKKERYTHLNAKFQRIARRDKKAFLYDQCKEIEETNRVGKKRVLFKKI